MKNQDGKKASSFPAYRNFVTERDRALEKILHDAQLEQSDILRGALFEITRVIAAELIKPQPRLASIQPAIQYWLGAVAAPFVDIVQDTRRRAFVLSAVGEGEALGRVRPKRAVYDVGRQAIERVLSEPMLAGGSVIDRVRLYCDRLARRIEDAVQLGLTQRDPAMEVLDRVFMAFPEVKRLKRQRPVLRRLKEADRDLDAQEPLEDFATGFVSDEEWNDVVRAYLDDWKPSYRAPESLIDKRTLKGIPADEQMYQWELEKDITEEFVRSVRQGQVETATKNGVKEFVWLAIVDDRTDQCCLWRDGMTTSQIERELSGSHSKDRCRALVPPAHFNCRCRLAPVLSETVDVGPSNTKEFQEWLET